MSNQSDERVRLDLRSQEDHITRLAEAITFFIVLAGSTGVALGVGLGIGWLAGRRKENKHAKNRT